MQPGESIFERDGELFVPSGHTRGPWDPGAMHGGAPAALIARAVEAVTAPVEMRCARITIEFLRAVPIAPVRVEAAPVREGKRVQLVEALLSGEDGTELCRARAVRIRAGEVAVPDTGEGEPFIPGPESAAGRPFPGDPEGEGFHLTAMDIRFVYGSYREEGPALAWFRLRMPVVAGEEPSPLQRAAAAADFGNGVSRVLDFRSHLFVNTDLSVHLQREPVGEWVALDARTDVDRSGMGQATSALFDADGRFGVAAQSLFVDER